MSYAPPTVGPQGLTIPSYNDILEDNLQGFQNIFGQSQDVGPDSAIYQLLSILSLKQSDTMEGLQLSYNSRSPQMAIGAGLDGVVKLNGIARLPYSFSTAILLVSGTPATVIVNGFAQDVNGNQWALPGTVTIPGGGSVSVTAICTTPGNIVAEPGDISIIATPVGGWASVTNSAAATPGKPVESDSELRGRQSVSVSLPSETLLAGTVAGIAATPNVTRYEVLENPTNVTDSYGNPPHSITAVVEGGTDLAVATTIYNNRGIGCYTNGTTVVSVTDPNTGFVMPIQFYRPSYVPIYVIVNIHNLSGTTSATETAIQTAIVNYLNSLQIGEIVTQSALYGIALSVMPSLETPMFSIYSIYLATTPAPASTSDIVLTFTQVAEGLTANVAVNLV